MRKQLAKETRVLKRIEKKESQKAAAAKRKEDTQAFIEQLSEQERAEMREKARLKREVCCGPCIYHVAYQIGIIVQASAATSLNSANKLVIKRQCPLHIAGQAA